MAITVKCKFVHFLNSSEYQSPDINTCASLFLGDYCDVTCICDSGWDQPNWFALPGDDVGYKPSYKRTNWFEPVGRECEMVMNRAGIIDVTPFGKIEVKGPDACKFIDTICANSVPKVNNFQFLSGLYQ